MTIKVLLADDDPRMRKLVFQTLEGNSNYELLEAENGLEALEVVRAHRPDLVILDIKMPELDGFEVCYQIRQDSRTVDTRVIMLTSLDDPSYQVMGTQVGADDYFTKPFSPFSLLSKIDDILADRPLARSAV